MHLTRIHLTRLDDRSILETEEEGFAKALVFGMKSTSTLTFESDKMTPPVETTETQNSEMGVVFAYIACILIWGTTWFAVRQCVVPGAFDPFTACAMRFIIAAVFLTALFLTRIVKAPFPDRKTLLWTMLCSLLSVLSFALVYSAEKWVSGGVAAIISTTTPVITALAATITRTEKIFRGQIVGMVISMMGILLIFGDRLHVSAQQGDGVLMLMSSVVLSSVSGVILKKHTTHQNPFVSVAIFVAVCAVSFITLSLVIEGPCLFSPPPLVPTLAAAYLGIVSSIISFACYFYLLKRISLMAISKLVFFPPIIALIVDALFETQVVLDMTTYIGISLTLLGVATRFPEKKKSS